MTLQDQLFSMCVGEGGEGCVKVYVCVWFCVTRIFIYIFFLRCLGLFFLNSNMRERRAHACISFTFFPPFF